MKNETLRIMQIQQAVAKITGMPVEMINVRSRKREIVAMRQLCMYFSKQFTRESLCGIGLKNGGYDHATVLHAIRNIREKVEVKDSLITPDYYRILDLLNKTPGMVIQHKKSVTAKGRLLKVKELVKNRVPLETRKMIIEAMQN